MPPWTISNYKILIYILLDRILSILKFSIQSLSLWMWRLKLPERPLVGGLCLLLLRLIGLRLCLSAIEWSCSAFRRRLGLRLSLWRFGCRIGSWIGVGRMMGRLLCLMLGMGRIQLMLSSDNWISAN